MGKWSLGQKFVLFLMHIFIFSDVVFSSKNDAIILPKYFIKTEKEAKKRWSGKEDQWPIATANSIKKKL